jgi:hypothetical protein
MNKNAIQKRYIQLQSQLERISYLANNAKQLILDGSFRQYMDVSFEAARLLEKVTVGMRELVVETAFTDKAPVLERAAEIQGITIEFTEGWYRIVMPVLLPGKRSGQSSAFIEAPLRYAVERYAREHSPERLLECVVCFRHIYGPDFPERAIRDHDNIECKKVQDVIADKLMVDDAGVYCSNFHVTCMGAKDVTEVYVIPAGLFPEWLKKHPIKQ